jgi:TonB-dependent receptor
VRGGEKNLGISFTASSYYTNRFYNNIDIDWERITVATNPQMTLPTPIDPGGGLPPFMSFLEASHSEYNIRSTNTYGINGSIDYRFDEHNSVYFRPLYSHYNLTGNKYETDWDIDRRFQDAIGGRKTYDFVTWTSGRGTTGANGSRASIGYIGTDEASHNNLYAFSTGSRHERGTSTLTFDFYYSWSKFQRDFAEYNMLLEPIAEGYYLMEFDVSNGRMYPEIRILNGLSPTDLQYATTTNLILTPRKKTEEIFSAKVDWEKKFIGDRSASALKLGAKFRSSGPKYDQTNFSYAVAPAQRAQFPFGNMLRPSDAVVFGLPRYMTAHPQPARELLVARPDLFTMNQFATFNASNTPDYNAKEETSAAYGQYSMQFGRHTILGGVRVERVEWSNQKKDVRGRDSIFRIEPRTVGSTYTNWLPGLHFRHEVRKNLILRESYNRSYGRPSLGILSRGRSENIAGNITDGNDQLQPLISDNFDVQLEYYTARGGLYSVGFFLKDIKNFTFSNVYRFNELDANDIPIPDGSGAFTYTKPINGETAKNKGIELIARQRLFFLPGPLKGLSASVSATFTDGKAGYPNRPGEKLPLPGFSDFMMTSSLEYAWGKFSSRIDYRYRADYIEGLDVDFSRDDWFGAREQVDAEVHYRIRKNWSAFVTGQNLTQRPLVSYQGYKYFVEDLSMSGRKFTFGMEYKF